MNIPPRYCTVYLSDICIPRIFGAEEWQRLELGLKQRVRALNAFLHDIYHDKEIIKASVISAHQVSDNAQYLPEMQRVDLPDQVYAHIAGIDLVREAAPPNVAYPVIVVMTPGAVRPGNDSLLSW
jgi:uncharacterized circularly permuted ATP-grasp superfamily protein